MALKIISFIFVISLTFGLANATQAKALPSRTQVRRDVPFNVNEVINRYPTPNHQSLTHELTGEFLVDTTVFYPPTSFRWPNIQGTRIATDGENYFVTWQDWRDGDGKIYGSRVSQSGEILDPAAILISLSPGNNKQGGELVFGGSNYLVIWRQPETLFPTNWDMYGARVNQNGVVLDTTPIAISTLPRSDQTPGEIAFDGNNYLVVWEDHRVLPGEIYGARVTQSGEVLDPNGFPISTALNSQSDPSVAFDGTNYLVVWKDERSAADEYDIYGARVNPSGVVLDPNGIAISTDTNSQGNPSIDFDGTNYLVVWTDGRNGEDNDIYGARISPSGVVLDSSGFAISTAVDDQLCPGLAFDGENYLVVWGDYRNIYGARVSRSGILLDTTEIIISTHASGLFRFTLCVAFCGSNYLAAWLDSRFEEFYNVFGSRVSPSGIVLDTAGINISKSGNSQGLESGSSVAFDGTNYLVVWEDWRDWTATYCDIYGVRIAQSGSILDRVSFPISTASGRQRYPSVAFDGTNYLVVWEDRRSGFTFDIYGARVTTSGVVLDPEGIAISTRPNDQFWSSVAFDGTNYLVVWTDGVYYDPSTLDIYGARVNQSGIVIDPEGFAISTAYYQQQHPVAAFGDSNYLVVWWDRRDPDQEIYGARLNLDGTVLDTNGVNISAEPTSGQIFPSITFDGTNYFVVWSGSRGGSCICGARVSQSNVVIDTIGIVISNIGVGYYQIKTLPSVAFVENNYLVVWEDQYDWPTPCSNIYGARVNLSGIVTDSFPVSTQANHQGYPVLARGYGSQALITYSGWTDYINSHPANTLRIWGKFYPFVGIAEENSKVKIQSEKLLEVYPNPAKSYFTIRLPQSADRQEIKIFDVSGKLIKEIATPASQSRNDREIKITLNGISPGIYFFRLGKETKKFLVVK
jgi:hypothetical protein